MTMRIALGISIIALLSGGALADKPCPNVMLVLDASGSMLEDPDGRPPGDPGFTKSKWQMLREVMRDCVQEYGDRVPFGVMIYSGGGSDDATCANQCKVQV